MIQPNDPKYPSFVHVDLLRLLAAQFNKGKPRHAHQGMNSFRSEAATLMHKYDDGIRRSAGSADRYTENPGGVAAFILVRERLYKGPSPTLRRQAEDWAERAGWG